MLCLLFPLVCSRPHILLSENVTSVIHDLTISCYYYFMNVKKGEKAEGIFTVFIFIECQTN